MKVLRILNRFNLGGPTHNAAFLTKYLEPEFKTKLIAGIKLDSEIGSEFMLKKLGIKPIYVKEMHRELSLSNDFKAFLEIKKIIREFRPDIVHTHAAKSGALGRLAAISENVPVIVHTFHGHVFHSYFGKLKSSLYVTIERFLAKYSSKVIAISSLQKKDLVNKFSICEENKIETIPLGFNLEIFNKDMDTKRDEFRKKYNLDNEIIAIGIIGRLTKIKNHELFLRAAKNLLLATEKKVRFFIIGDGEDKNDLIDLADTLQIRHRENSPKGNQLFFTSWIQHIDIALAGLDIVALTSLNEGTPVTLIEAKASKKPVISTDVGGVGDIIRNQVTGILVPSDDLDTFSMELIELVNNDEKRMMIAENGYDEIRKNFSYERLVKDMRELYTKLLKDK